MTEKPSPDPTAASPGVEIDVARTGGIAGMTRRWSAQPPEAEASEWISLIDRCPWSEATASDQHSRAQDEDPDRRADAPSRLGHQRAAPVPDGFVWFIRATWSGTDPREAELPDDEVVGAWRDLVEAVRDWSRHASGSGRESR